MRVLNVENKDIPEFEAAVAKKTQMFNGKGAKEKFFTLFAIFALFTSFNTIFGAVPLLYPYPWISLGLIMITIDTQKIFNTKNFK